MAPTKVPQFFGFWNWSKRADREGERTSDQTWQLLARTHGTSISYQFLKKKSFLIRQQHCPLEIKTNVFSEPALAVCHT